MLNISYKSQSFWFKEYVITINLGVQCSSYKEKTNLSSTLKIAHYFFNKVAVQNKRYSYLG